MENQLTKERRELWGNINWDVYGEKRGQIRHNISRGVEVFVGEDAGISERELVPGAVERSQ